MVAWILGWLVEQPATMAARATQSATEIFASELIAGLGLVR